MRHEARLERLLIGLRGLGLLREWPFGDSGRADEQLRAIADLLAHRDEPPMNVALDLEELGHGAGYAAWSESYDGPNPLIDVEEAILRPMIEGLEPGRAIDAASGTGRLASILSELGHDVVGVDASEPMLDRARAKGIPASFERGSYEDLPVDDHAFDLVTCTLALTHTTDLVPPMREFARVLRPGGRVILSDVHPIAIATGAQAFFHRSDGSRAVTTNHQHWTADYIRAFAAAGFMIERCEEPLVAEGYKMGFGSEDVRAAGDLGITGLPLLLIWVLRLE
jgi:ubiquinone/menaquinone biosynthesis C-methylase UbiE